MMEEIGTVAALLGQGGLHEALRFLNARTSHRFTGVYRFDGEMLRSVALFDRWDPETRCGEDVPIDQAYCGIVQKIGMGLEVPDGRGDGRYPWLAESQVQSYCGVLIVGPEGEPIGALCHYDLQRCQTATGEMPLMAAVAPLIAQWLVAAQA